MRAHPCTLRRIILVAALLVPAPLLAAGHACASPADSGRKDTLEEPEEVASNARETVSRMKPMQAWMKRLVGRYTVDGYVDLCGKGNTKDQRPATGKLDCIEATLAVDVHCKFVLKWPPANGESGSLSSGDASSIAPAQLLFSFEHPWVGYIHYHVSTNFFGDGANNLGIGLVQVDNNGVGEYASGVLVGDTFLSTEPCMDIPGDCHRITRIAINPENTGVSMTVEMRVDGQRVMRQVFTMHRRSDAGKAR